MGFILCDGFQSKGIICYSVMEKDHAGCHVKDAWRGRPEGRRLVQVGNDRCTGQGRAVTIDTRCELPSVGTEEEKRVPVF